MVKGITSSHEITDNSDQVASYGATNAAVIHFKNFFISVNHQLMINAHLTEFINNHSNSLTMIFSQNTIK